MINFEKQFIIKILSELLAYEIYDHYIQGEILDDIESVYNMVHTEFVHNIYKKEIIDLGTSMAINLYEVPIPNKN